MDGLLGISFALLDRFAGLVFLAAAFYFLHEKASDPADRKARLSFFDVVKGIAILGVVGIHTVGIVSEGASLNRIIWASLPLFVLASGYLLGWRHNKKIDLGEYAKGIFWRLILPYVVFSVFLSLTQPQKADLASIVLDVLLGRQNGDSLYFIPLLIQLYALFPLFEKYKKWLLHPVGLILLFLLSYSLSDWDHGLRADSWNANLLSLVFCGRYLFYFAFGIWLSRWDLEKERLKGVLSLLVAGALLLAVSFNPAGWDQPFFYPIWVLFLLHVLYQAVKSYSLGKLLCAILSQFGQYSLMIYLLHAIVIYQLIDPFKSQLPVGGLGAYALITLLATTISWALGKVVWDSYNIARRWSRR